MSKSWELEADKDGRAFMRAFDVVVPHLSGAVPRGVSLTDTTETTKIASPKAAKKKAAGITGKTF